MTSAPECVVAAAAQECRGPSARFAIGTGGSDRGRHPWGSCHAAALGQPQPASPGEGAGGARVHGEPACCGEPVARFAIQLPEQPQDPRGQQPPGPRCAVRSHQCDGEGSACGREPAISVDTKKKELVRDFKNAVVNCVPRVSPSRCGPSLQDPGTGKVAPYGVYDIAANHGWVSVGVDADTAPSPSRASAAGGRSSARFAIPRLVAW